MITKDYKQQEQKKIKEILNLLIDIKFLLNDKYFLNDKKQASIKRCIKSIEQNLI